jgi:ubiquinone biosynthesis protein
VHWEHTTRRVLTLERVGGIKISDLEALDGLGIPRRAIAENAVRIFLREVLEFGFFHADPHPGNFFVQEDGAIAIVDFGMVGRVSEELQLRLLRAGLAAMNQDAEALAEELYAIGVAGRRAERSSFQRDLDHLIGRYGGYSIHELSASEVTAELIGVVQHHRLQLPAELALLLRVVTMSEGIGLRLDPDFHYLEYASPLFRRRWEQQNSLRAGAARLKRVAMDTAQLGLELPRRTGRLLGRLERGELELNVQHEGLERFSHSLQRMTNRLALAIVLAASVIALGVGLGVHARPTVSIYLDWLFRFGFAFTLVFGVALLWSMSRGQGR